MKGEYQMYKIEKRLEKIDRQIEMLLQQKKKIEEAKKEKEKVKVVNLSETKKKQLIRLGKVLDEAGIKTVKQARELLSYSENLASTLNSDDKMNEITIEESKSNKKDYVLEKIEEVIENQIKEKKSNKNVNRAGEEKWQDKIDDVKVFKAKDEKKVNREDKTIPRQTRKDKSKEVKKKINNAKSKEKTRNRLFG